MNTWDEYIYKTYPDFTPKQAAVYKEVINTANAMCTTTAEHDEMILKLTMTPEEDEQIFNDPDKYYHKVINDCMKRYDREIDVILNDFVKRGILTTRDGKYYEMKQPDYNDMIEIMGEILLSTN
jgi:hypothetical protein